ncbi:MAG: protein containing prepilin-type N- cleavage/methylation domain protein [Sulfurimonas sp. RIFCSPLOWO2_12_36_12]|uniref:type II secretion system protein n=1 Tax=Sulfurimonas sp. RIFCSPLOWO2_12_36_12 TaxID=1802253 RepID=UPI0008BBA50E|nr:type II secretion system protein [Sulfurimonas sp. RIFCSPLOWO2_12_36_12]OHE02951.1 MAG: protein containing prepilin-type N- cleavage/methylation domain protein [Sulfurimonas sp. RIFCSPLOWO2_12_36_12]
MRKSAFTLLELIFVIVVIGILSKFGIELLAQAYKSFIFSSINNSLQANSAMAVETIASRLQYRIKDSVIARRLNGTFVGLAGNTDPNIPILEWVGTDIDGFRGNAGTAPLWSGIIDLDLSGSAALVSPATDTGALNTLIGTLSNTGSGINDAALYFVGSDSDINNYGWSGVALTDHNTSVMHPINSGANVDEFVSGIGGVNFSGADIYEYYQLAWTAYAVGITDYNASTNTGTLTLWYDYQPWNGQNYATHGKPVKLMDGVSTFQFKAVGSIVKIQVCVNSDVVEDYSLCKEKTIF